MMAQGNSITCGTSIHVIKRYGLSHRELLNAAISRYKLA